jgi:hypothetical protein
MRVQECTTRNVTQAMITAWDAYMLGHITRAKYVSAITYLMS